MFKVLAFAFYFLKFRASFAIGLHRTANPKNLKWRWKYWNRMRGRAKKKKRTRPKKDRWVKKDRWINEAWKKKRRSKDRYMAIGGGDRVSEQRANLPSTTIQDTANLLNVSRRSVVDAKRGEIGEFSERWPRYDTDYSLLNHTPTVDIPAIPNPRPQP